MKLELQRLNNWLLGAVLLVILLRLGQPLLVPLTFSLLLWGMLNAFVDFTRRLRLPGWLAWSTAFAIIAACLYVIAAILTNEAAALAHRVPDYAASFERLWSSHKWLQRILPTLDFTKWLNEAEIFPVLRGSIGSIGTILFNLVLIAVFVSFLLLDQRYLPHKLARFRETQMGREGEAVLRLVLRRIESYLGVCFLVSVAMGVISYALLATIGLQFAGFWALVMFFLTYIPVMGAVGAALPALLALLQFGSLGPALVILVVLGVAHFILTDVIETIVLGHSMNLSPFVIMVALTFWGLVWGVPGLFLAVPLTSAIAIACRHVEGLDWIADLVAGPARWRHSWSFRRRPARQ